jgi:hypothetical protein
MDKTIAHLQSLCGGGLSLDNEAHGGHSLVDERQLSSDGFLPLENGRQVSGGDSLSSDDVVGGGVSSDDGAGNGLSLDGNSGGGLSLDDGASGGLSLDRSSGGGISLASGGQISAAHPISSDPAASKCAAKKHGSCSGVVGGGEGAQCRASQRNENSKTLKL